MHIKIYIEGVETMKEGKRYFSILMIIASIMLVATMTMAEEGNKINLNTATVEDLMQIKGVGKSYAERIIEYREKNGPFKEIEDIMKVKGIGPKTFEKIQAMLQVE